MMVIYCDCCTKVLGKDISTIRLVVNGVQKEFEVCDNCKKDFIDRLSNAKRRYIEESKDDTN